MHMDKQNKRRQRRKAWTIGMEGQRLKDLFYKYFGLVLADGDGRALMKLSGHVKAWWGSPNATLTVAPQPPFHAKNNYSIITGAVQVPAGHAHPSTSYLPNSLFLCHPPTPIITPFLCIAATGKKTKKKQQLIVSLVFPCPSCSAIFIWNEKKGDNKQTAV